MTPWAQMTVGARTATAAGIAAVLAVLGYGLWSTNRPAPDATVDAALTQPATEGGTSDATPVAEPTAQQQVTAEPSAQVEAQAADATGEA
ncbi:MAG: hypothetical protein V4804_07310, partial [Pseudomonadota bacterium]